MKSILTFFFTLALSVCMSQKIEYPSLGVSFSVPIEFNGQETLYGYSMSDNINHRYMFIRPHGAKSIDVLDRHLNQSQIKMNGYTLYFNPSRERIDDQAFGKTFSATADQGYNFNGYAIIIMRDKGQGMSVISATPQSAAGTSPKDLAMSLYNSISFSTPVRDEKLKMWSDNLKNKHLINISSHYSSDVASEFSTGGDTQTDIWLCDNHTGHYKFKSSWSGSSSTGFTGYSTSANEIHGEWNIFYNLQSQPVLRIMDKKGNVMQFLLYFDGRNLSLNGSRFSTGDYNCH